MSKHPARTPEREPAYDPNGERYWDPRDLEQELLRVDKIDFQRHRPRHRSRTSLRVGLDCKDARILYDHIVEYRIGLELPRQEHVHPTIWPSEIDGVESVAHANDDGFLAFGWDNVDRAWQNRQGKSTDVNRFLRDVATGKTAAVEKTGKLRGKAVVEGGAGTAARTTGLLGGILSFAVSEGIISTNPASGVRKPADGQRERRLSPGEYRQLGKALQAAEDEGENAQAITGIWLLMLTGCRLSEIENSLSAQLGEMRGSMQDRLER